MFGSSTQPPERVSGPSLPDRGRDGRYPHGSCQKENLQKGGQASGEADGQEDGQEIREASGAKDGEEAYGQARYEAHCEACYQEAYR